MNDAKFPWLKSIGKDAAIAMANGKYWEPWGFRQRAEFQMVTSELSMPFTVFHEALEKTLGRPVFTHELAMNTQGLYDELFNGKPSPTSSLKKKEF